MITTVCALVVVGFLNGAPVRVVECQTTIQAAPQVAACNHPVAVVRAGRVSRECPISER